MTDQITKSIIGPIVSGQMQPMNESSADTQLGEFPNNQETVQLLIDVVPQVMQVLRSEMRRRRGPEISVLQFRVLAFLRRHPGSTLSAVAEHVGLTLPSMSSQISGLVARHLIDRSVSEEDRRYVTLTLTDQGRTLMESARQGTQESIAKKIAVLSPEELAVVAASMNLLSQVFSSSVPVAIPSEGDE